MPTGVNVGAFMAGFGIAEIAMATVWVALYSFALLRRLLSWSET
jgi:hypothetical protein